MEPSGLNIAKLVMGVVALVGVVFAIVLWFQYKNTEFNNGPWSFSEKSFPFVLRGDQLLTKTQGSYTLEHYLYIDGSQEMRSNPQAIWRWGASDPLRGITPSILVSYVPSQEQLLFEFTHVSSGDNRRVASLYVPNIVQRRWFHISLIVEGRTIDVYTNGEHAKSIQLPNVLKGGSEGVQMIGGTGILGKMAIWRVTEGRMSDAEVKRAYSSTSDKMGAPVLPFDFTKFNLSNFSLTLCPGLPWCEEVEPTCDKYVKYEYA